MVEIVSVQCNLVDNEYQQQKSKMSYTFTANRSFAYLLNVEPRHLVLLKAYNAKFDDIFITFTDEKCDH